MNEVIEPEVRLPADAGIWAVTPIIEWLVLEGWRVDSTPRLIDSLARRLVAAGVPLWRVFCLVPTLHPLYVGAGYRWSRGDAEVRRGFGEHGVQQTEAFLNNPPKLIIVDGFAAVRRRLDDGYAAGEFPLLDELRAEGATDYVAMPLEFTSGQRTVVSFASDRPGGFSQADLKQFFDLLPVLARLVEQDTQRSTTENLLRTYVGTDAAARILAGQVMRGDSQTIFAAIWYADLRDFTGHSQAMPRDELLEALNAYFDAMSLPVQAHGGQILKFIGDGVLGIFPVDARDDLAEACRKAIGAARDACAAMHALNAAREERGQRPLGYGLALHIGEVVYGNIGAADRLDYTVIGPAVNIAQRLEQLCKQLDRRPLISSAFAAASGVPARSVGRFALKGIAEEHEVFAPLDC